MIPLLAAALAGSGAYLFYSHVFPTPSKQTSPALSQVARHINDWKVQAGVGQTNPTRLLTVALGLAVAGAVGAWLIFGGVLAPMIAALFAATVPFATLKQRRAKRRAEAAEAWPRMIEEVRLMCGSLGKPIPQALIDVGKRGPQEMRPAFQRAEREWAMTTDFARTVKTLKDGLADPTADAVCETLLVAHTVGGSDVDKRLSALARDRDMELQGRKDAMSKQAGVRFARKFVLIVPFGMALAGMSIGDGRSAYQTAEGQLAVAVGLMTLMACWFWAGRLIRLPESRRVLRG